MKFDNLTKEQIEMFLESPFNDGDSGEYGLFWVWDWDTLEIITENTQGFIEVHSYTTQEELTKALAELEAEYHAWLVIAGY